MCVSLHFLFGRIRNIRSIRNILRILNFPIIQIFLATDNIDSWLSGRAFQALSCQCVDRMIGHQHQKFILLYNHIHLCSIHFPVCKSWVIHACKYMIFAQIIKTIRGKYTDFIHHHQIISLSAGFFLLKL